MLGSANAQDVEMTVMGDNVMLLGNNPAANKFSVGAILQADGNGLSTKVNASAATQAEIAPSEIATTPAAVDDVLGDGSNTETPVTTVLQAMTGVMLS